MPRVLAVGIQHASMKPSSRGISKQRSTTSRKIGAGLQNKIRSQVTEAKNAGFQLDMVAVKSASLDLDLKRIQEQLANERPELLIVGFGIRGSPELTVFFEQLISTCREASPQTKIGFNTAFDKNLEVCERCLGKQTSVSE